MFSLSLSMNKMEKEFVPYQEALALKELGFDEPCINFGYIYEGKYKSLISTISNTNSSWSTSEDKSLISIPTYSQAFRWFREKYKLQTYIDFYHSESYFFKIKSQDGKCIGNIGYIILQGSPVFTRTYEEAELACLKKLIEIVKEK